MKWWPVSVRQRVKKIKSLPEETREITLRELGRELGCDLSGTHTPSARHLEEEVIRRILASDKGRREDLRGLITAVITVIGVLVAIAALVIAIAK